MNSTTSPSSIASVANIASLASIGFGPLLRAERERAGYSQSALAEAAGTDHSMVSRLESGERMPGRGTALALAGALGLDPVARDRLLLSAGFAPIDPVGVVLAELPEVAELVTILRDPDTNPANRLSLRAVVRHAVSTYQAIRDLREAVA